MEKNKGQISLTQLMLLFIVTVYTPSVRFIASFTSKNAKQAAWIAILFTLIPYIILIYIFQKIFNKYKEESYMDIIYNICTKFIGKIIVSLYLIWLTFLLALNVRYYAERLVTSIYPNVNINIFIIVMLIIVSEIIRTGIVVIARMNEVIFLFITIVFLLLVSLIIPNAEINNLTPISTLDIVPVLKASVGPTGLIYLPYLLFFSHKVKNKDKFFNYGFKTGLFLAFIELLIIISSVGYMGYSLIERAPLSFLIAVKEINILGVLTGFQSILVATWIVADFIIIIIFTYSIMHMFKSIFNLSDYKPLINVYLIILFFLSKIIADRVFELQALSAHFVVYINIVFQIIIPIIIFGIAKLRKKI